MLVLFESLTEHFLFEAGGGGFETRRVRVSILYLQHEKTLTWGAPGPPPLDHPNRN